MKITGEKSGDFLYPSDNYEGFATLDINRQGDSLDYPLPWGSVRRNNDFSGRTILFYVDDNRFNVMGNAVMYGHVYWKLWERPDKVWWSGAPSFIEVNFSTSNSQPFWVAASQIGKKRQLSKLFQDHGMRCWVDLNVAPRWEELNLVGVPRGWQSYATRIHMNDDVDYLHHQHELACAHAMSDNIKFVVYGHRKEVEALCMHEGWIYVPEDWSKRDAAKAKKKALQNEIIITDERQNKQEMTLEAWC